MKQSTLINDRTVKVMVILRAKCIKIVMNKR